MPGPRPVGVVARQAHDLQAGHLSRRLVPAEVGEEPVRPGLIPVIQVESAVHRVDMAREGWQDGRGRIGGGLAVGHKLAVASVADARPGGLVPQITQLGRAAA